MKLNDIKKVGILGAGTLGLRVGLRCAMDGYQVSVYDLNAAQFPIASKIQDMILRRQVKKGLLPSEEIDKIKARISFTTDRKELAKDADLINESVTEHLETKLEVYQEFAPLWESHTLLTTNTSYLVPSQIKEATGRPALFCAFHFHDVFSAKVVDIMPHPETASWVPELLEDFGKDINQIPVHVTKETPGYIFNAMLMALLGTAGDLVCRGLASPEDVDRSWMGNMGTEIGPFGMIDQIGLKTAWHVTSGRKDKRSVRFAELLTKYIEAKKLGIQSGEGFYKYPNPSFTHPDFLA